MKNPAARPQGILTQGYLFYHILSLTPQQATGNALAIRFKKRRFGKPKNPDHLLKAGELLSWFHDWKVIYAFEGTIGVPPKAVAQLVCRKS